MPHPMSSGTSCCSVPRCKTYISERARPRARKPWKLTVLQPPEVLRQGRVRAIPAEVTHIGICVDGGWAIETSGLLEGGAQSIQDALDTLAAAPDDFANVS